MVGRPLTNDWSKHLDPLFKRDSFQRLEEFLQYQKDKKISIFPINEDEWSDLGNWNSLKKFTN